MNDSTDFFLGLGLAHIGSCHPGAIQIIMDFLEQDTRLESMLGAAGCLALGLIGHSSADGALLSRLITGLTDPGCRLAADDTLARVHAIGLAVLGRPELAPTLHEALAVIPAEAVRDYSRLFVDICAYAGSSNILKVQQLLRVAQQGQPIQQSGPSSSKSTSSTSLSSSSARSSSIDYSFPGRYGCVLSPDERMKMVAILGIGLISMGDELNTQAMMRNFGFFLQKGDLHLKSASILAIALLHLSTPKVAIIELLSKYTHFSSLDAPQAALNVAITAILSLGLVGAGSNNARIAKLLQSLVEYYRVQREALFAVRVAQGLLHLGKGALTLAAVVDGTVRHSSAASVLLFALQLLQADPVDFPDLAWEYLSLLTPAIRSRALITLDPDTLEPVQVAVRVGAPVDILGQAGKPRTVTGFQTYPTPVLLSPGDGVEMDARPGDAAEGEAIWQPLCSKLEGVVLVTKKKPPTGADAQQAAAEPSKTSTVEASKTTAVTPKV